MNYYKYEKKRIKSVVAKTCDTENKEREGSELDKISNKPTEPITFSCKHLFVNSSYIPKDFQFDSSTNSKEIARCILITDKSIYYEDKANNSNNVR
jgi:hypothetical protein